MGIWENIILDIGKHKCKGHDVGAQSCSRNNIEASLPGVSNGVNGGQ